jgi:hypothetical protein
MIVFCIRWYFKSIRRIDAEKQLMSEVNDHGSFLVCYLINQLISYYFV